MATPGVYYKGGIKYTGCQKMKRHPTAFLPNPLRSAENSVGREVTVSYEKNERRKERERRKEEKKEE